MDGNKESFIGKNWYFGNISLGESENLLMKYGEEGDFIVRESSYEEGYALDVKCARRVRRITIYCDTSYYIDHHRAFHSMDSLLQYYTDCSPSLKSGGNLKLRKPLVVPQDSATVHKTNRFSFSDSDRDETMDQDFGSKSWYFGNISLEDSERLLNTYGSEGDFIVRDSSCVGSYVLEVKCKGRVRRVRIYAEDGYFYIHKISKFRRMDHLLDHYTSCPPAVISEEPDHLYPKKPLAVPPEEGLLKGYMACFPTQPSPLAEDVRETDALKPSVMESTEDIGYQTIDHAAILGKLRNNMAELERKLTEIETSGLQIPEDEFETALSNVGKKVSKTYFDMWSRKKDVTMSFFRKTEEILNHDGEKLQEEEEKEIQDMDEDKKYTAEWNRQQEVLILEKYINAICQTIKLKINLEDCWSMTNQIASLHQEHQNLAEDVSDEFWKKKLNKSGESHQLQEKEVNNGKEATAVEGQVRKEDQMVMENKLHECKDIFSKASKLIKRLRPLFDSMKDEQNDLKKEGKKYIHEELRYTSEDVLYMHQIISRTTQQCEQLIQDIERTTKETSEMETDLRRMLTSMEIQLGKTDEKTRQPKSRRNKPHTEKWEIPNKEGGSFQKCTLSLGTLCTELLSETDLQRANYETSATYAALFRKGFKTFACIRVRGNSTILRGPNSDAELHIPEGLDALFMGYAHTDASPFLEAIPEDECLVSPIAEYRAIYNKGKKPNEKWFKIKVPHSMRNKEDMERVKVRHGNIHVNMQFTEVSPEYYEVDEDYINIYTTHFSQFICTTCKKVCHKDGKAFIFGSISPPKYSPLTSALRLYLCSPLFRITDYKMDLIQSEKQYRSVLVKEADIQWDSTKYTGDKCTEISVWSPDWDPRPPPKWNQFWYPHTRRLVYTKEVSQMTDLLHCYHCNGCKSGPPSIAADFDFVLPKTDHGKSPKELTFSVFMEMFVKSEPNVAGAPILQAQIDIYPNETESTQSNQDHVLLREITKLLICKETELMDFGLHIGWRQSQIEQKMTNYPRSIETAAWSLACEWWDSEPKSCVEKSQILFESAEKVGKAVLGDDILKLLRKAGHETRQDGDVKVHVADTDSIKKVESHENIFPDGEKIATGSQISLHGLKSDVTQITSQKKTGKKHLFVKLFRSKGRPQDENESKLNGNLHVSNGKAVMNQYNPVAIQKK